MKELLYKKANIINKKFLKKIEIKFKNLILWEVD